MKCLSYFWSELSSLLNDSKTYCKVLRHLSISKDKQIPMTRNTRSYHPKSKRKLDNASNSKPWWYLFPTKLWYFERAVKIGFWNAKENGFNLTSRTILLDQERFWSLNKAFTYTYYRRATRSLFFSIIQL